MTVPAGQPPIVPAPPLAGPQPVTPAAPPAPRKVKAPGPGPAPLVAPARRPLPRGPVVAAAAAGGLAVAGCAAAWPVATAAAVGGGAAVAGGAVAVRRRLRLDPEKHAARRAKRPARGGLFRPPGSRPRRGLRDVLSNIRRPRGGKSSAGSGTGTTPARTPGPGGPNTGASPRQRRRGLARLFPDGGRSTDRGRGSPTSPAGGGASPRGGRLARLMPGARGREARAQARQDRAARGHAPSGSPSAAPSRGPAGRWRDRRAARRASLFDGTDTGSGGGKGKGKGKGGKKPRKTDPASTTPAPASPAGRRPRWRRRTPAAPPVAPAPDLGSGKAGKPGKNKTGKAPAMTAPPKPPGRRKTTTGATSHPPLRTRWRRGKAIPDGFAGQPAPEARWWHLRRRANARFGRTGSTSHTPTGDGLAAAPANPGKKKRRADLTGEGPSPVVPARGPRVADMTPAAGPSWLAPARRRSRDDLAAAGFAGRGHRTAAPPSAPRPPAPRPPAAPAAAAPAETPAARSRRQQLADSMWGPDGNRDDRTPDQARRAWQNRVTKGDPMTNRNHDGDPAGLFATGALINTGGHGGEVSRMDEDFPRLMDQADTAVADATATVARISATVDGETPSGRAVKDAVAEYEQQLRALHGKGAEIAALSRQVDQVGYEAGERYGHDPNAGAWTGR